MTSAVNLQVDVMYNELGIHERTPGSCYFKDLQCVMNINESLVRQQDVATTCRDLEEAWQFI